MSGSNSGEIDVFTFMNPPEKWFVHFTDLFITCTFIPVKFPSPWSDWFAYWLYRDKDQWNGGWGRCVANDKKVLSTIWFDFFFCIRKELGGTIDIGGLLFLEHNVEHSTLTLTYFKKTSGNTLTLLGLETLCVRICSSRLSLSLSLSFSLNSFYMIMTIYTLLQLAVWAA